MSLEDVDNIASDVKDDKERLLKVLRWWLTREQPKSTWSVLIESLRSCTIEECTLADDLQRKYCPQGNLCKTVLFLCNCLIIELCFW